MKNLIHDFDNLMDDDFNAPAHAGGSKSHTVGKEVKTARRIIKGGAERASHAAKQAHKRSRSRIRDALKMGDWEEAFFPDVRPAGARDVS